MTDRRSDAPRVRRPIAERVRDNLKFAFPLVLVPLDRTGDERIGDLLDQLRDELVRRSGRMPSASREPDQDADLIGKLDQHQGRRK